MKLSVNHKLRLKGIKQIKLAPAPLNKIQQVRGLNNKPTNFLQGIDRSIGPLSADKGSFYTLRNFRQSFEQRGRVEQTPYWSATQFTRGTYYNGGPLTEPVGSAVRLVAPDLLVTDYVCRNAAGQLQVFYQTCDDATETDVHMGCRVVINAVSGLGILLGNNLEIDIDGATTFRWENGGAYTSTIPITTAGVSIDGGNATVYFLAVAGFTVGTTWFWTRTDASFADPIGSFEYPCNYTYFKGDLFFNSVDDRIMVMLEAGTSGIKYVISAGYRPIVGSYFAFFDDHLVVTWFRRSVSGWVGTSERQIQVGWSDKTDVHNFIPTLDNEADEFTLPTTTQFDTVDTSANYLMGICVLNQTCFLFTNSEVYSSPALGLPNVFSFLKFMDLRLISLYSAVIKAEQSAYLIGHSDIYVFDGASIKSIGAKIVPGTDNASFEGAFGAYDPNRFELNIVLGTMLLVYQSRYDTWYTRMVDFSNSSTPATAIATYSGVVLGGADRKRFAEDQLGVTQPVFDDLDGTAYAEPYMVTQAFGRDLTVVKDTTAVNLGATVDSAGVDATYYTKNTDVVFQLSYWPIPAGEFTNATEIIPPASIWRISDPTPLISLPPNVAFRAVAFAIEIQGLNNKPPAFVSFSQLTPIMYNEEERSVMK